MIYHSNLKLHKDFINTLYFTALETFFPPKLCIMYSKLSTDVFGFSLNTFHITCGYILWLFKSPLNRLFLFPISLIFERLSIEATWLSYTKYTHKPHTLFPQNSALQNDSACLKEGGWSFLTGIQTWRQCLLMTAQMVVLLSGPGSSRGRVQC